MSHRLRPLQHALCAALPLLALQGTPAWAQSNTALQPSVTVLHHFTSASALGWLPNVPPIVGADGLLHGVTQNGGPALGSWGAISHGAAYRIDPNGQTAYQSTLMGNIASLTTTLVLGSDGTIYGGSATSNMNSTQPFGSPAFFSLQAGVPALVSLPTSGPRGQIAIDEQDRVYVGVHSSLLECSQTLRSPLWRLNKDGTETKVLDFCNYMVSTGVGTPQLHPKGGTPVASVWSKADQALYVVTAVAARGVVAGIPTSDNNGWSYGTLVKLSKAAIDLGAANNGVVPEEQVELLHTFQSQRDGQPTAQGSRLMGMVESGEWLYGTSYTNPSTGGTSTDETSSGTVWRVKKSDPSSFAVIHRFRADQVNAADGSPNADGGTPHGPLVAAADGHVYGTTSLDGRTTTSAVPPTPTGPGTLYRIRVGQQADRSDDVYEVLHRFELATEGGRPVGLSAGPVANGIQTLYGATSNGGTGNGGTVFSVDLQLPVSFSTALAASATAARVGDTITLSWSTDNASTCTASGDNGNTWTGTQPVSGGQVSLSAALSKVGVNTFTLNCENSSTGMSTAQTVSVTVAAASTSEGGSGGGGGSLGLGALLGGVLLSAARLRRRATPDHV